jgi:predicted ribonuclease YlaK
VGRKKTPFQDDGHFRTLLATIHDQISNRENSRRQLDHLNNYQNEHEKEHRILVKKDIDLRLKFIKQHLHKIVLARVDLLNNHEQRRKLFVHEKQHTPPKDVVIHIASEHQGESCQLQMQAPINDEISDRYLIERTRELQQVENSCHQISDMMNFIAIRVKEHEELLSRIDRDVERSQHDIDKGHSNLISYWNKMQSQRGSIFLKIFIIAVTSLITVGLIL